MAKGNPLHFTLPFPPKSKQKHVYFTGCINIVKQKVKYECNRIPEVTVNYEWARIPETQDLKVKTLSFDKLNFNFVCQNQ